MLHGKLDAYCSPELATALYEAATGSKEVRWLDATQHVDLYDAGPYVSQAVAATAAFLHRYL